MSWQPVSLGLPYSVVVGTIAGVLDMICALLKSGSRRVTGSRILCLEVTWLVRRQPGNSRQVLMCYRRPVPTLGH